MGFVSLSRLRKKESLRRLAAESRISVRDFVLPFFVIDGKNRKEEISTMPGVFRFSADRLIKEIGEVRRAGVSAILLFGLPAKKDARGSSAYDKNGPVQKACRAIKKAYPDTAVMTDVCLCGYTAHGHCGILRSDVAAGNRKQPASAGRPRRQERSIDSGATLKILSKIALSHAESGADVVAPSAMADGQVNAIRSALDENRFGDTAIMGYSAKYASGFYGPFREAAGSAPGFGDRKSYQMDYHNAREALLEAEEDVMEGADIIMIKPALAYLDLIKAVRESFALPIAAYNVSGEYSMVKAASARGWLDEKNTVLEILTSIKRAGADIIITYWAAAAAKWLKE